MFMFLGIRDGKHPIINTASETEKAIQNKETNFSQTFTWINLKQKYFSQKDQTSHHLHKEKLLKLLRHLSLNTPYLALAK